MAIAPDTKDWTWVIERRCPECGFDAPATVERDVATLLRENAAAWPEILERADVRLRPNDHTWSALEYAAHVRDVFRLYAYRLDLMLTQDDPLFPNWDQDETAVAERYNDQDPSVVASELVTEGNALADAFDAVPDAAWSRTGRRGDGAKFTIATFARYLIHDTVHHLWDVTK